MQSFEVVVNAGGQIAYDKNPLTKFLYFLLM